MAIKLTPGKGEYYYQRGELYRRLKDFARANEDIDEALKEEPRNLRFLMAKTNITREQSGKQTK